MGTHFVRIHDSASLTGLQLPAKALPLFRPYQRHISLLLPPNGRLLVSEISDRVSKAILVHCSRTLIRLALPPACVFVNISVRLGDLTRRASLLLVQKLSDGHSSLVLLGDFPASPRCVAGSGCSFVEGFIVEMNLSDVRVGNSIGLGSLVDEFGLFGVVDILCVIHLVVALRSPLRQHVRDFDHLRVVRELFGL